MAKSEWAEELEAVKSAPPEVPQGEESEWQRELKAVRATAPAAVEPAKGAARLEAIPQQALTGSMSLIGLPGTLQGMAKATGPWGDPNTPDWKTDPKVGRAFVNYLTGGLPTGADLEKATGLGMSNHPELAPQNAVERYGGAILAAAPAALLTGGLGATTAITTTVGGAVAAQAAHDYDPDNHWLPVVAGVLGSMGAGWATSSAKGAIAASAATKEYKAALKSLDDLEKESLVLNDPRLRQKPPALQIAENRLNAAQDAHFAATYPGVTPPPTRNQLALGAAQDAQVEGRMEAARIADGIKASSRQELDATRKMGEDAVAAVDSHVGSTFETHANELGTTKTLDEAGEVLQAGARNWVEKVFPKKLAEVKAPLDAAIPGSTEMQVDNYRAVLEKMAPKPGALQSQLDILSSPLPKALKKGLDDTTKTQQAADDLAELVEPETVGLTAIRQGGKIFTGQTHSDGFQLADAAKLTGPIEEGYVTNTGRFVDRAEALKIAKAQKQVNVSDDVTELSNEVGKISPTAKTVPTWEEVRALRSRLGDAMANPSLMKGMDQSEISALYSALTSDLGKAAKVAGAEDLWKAFNEESTRLYGVRDGVMSKLISTKNAGKEVKVTPAQAAASLVSAGRKGGTELAVLQQELPEGMKALSSFQLRSPQNWGKLSPEAKALLVPDEGKRVVLDQALGAKAEAQAAAKAEFKAATQKYNDTVSAANTGAKDGNFSRLQEVRAQQKMVEAERRQATAVAARQDRARAQALREAQADVERAQEAHRLETETAAYEMRKRLAGKKEVVEQAKAGLPPPAPNVLQEVYKNRGAILAGMTIGNELIPGLVSSAGMSPLQAGTGLAIGATVVPPLWNAAKAAVKNPKLLSIPASGIVSGQNALALPEPR